MRFSLLALVPFLGSVLAQQSSSQCDTVANICFQGMTDAVHGVSYRVVFPPLVTSGANSTEFIGEIVAPIAIKWAAMALGGAMLTNPLIMAWPNGASFVTTARWATTYDQPVVYTGSTLTTLPSSTINSTHWKWVFRCQSCTTWTGGSGGMNLGGTPVFAWSISTVAVDTPSSSSSTFAEHTDFGFWGNQVGLAHDSNYNDYLDGFGSGGATTGTPTSTTTSAPTATAVPAANDYIVIGSGYGGIIAADRLSQAGKKVLLLERGGPSTYETGGRELPPWAPATQYTRFDVPGLFESMFGASNPYWWCKDVGVIGGCLVGGGGSVNSALYWIPPDFEYAASNGWPSGWNTISTYVAKVLARLPSNDNPSTDGIRYVDQVYTLISTFLGYQGYSNITINSNPNQKDHAFGHPAYDFIDGKRGGPVATYLRTATARSNFQLKIYTYATSLVRTKGKITGVRTNDTSVKDGIYPLTAKGRVILSAGTFGSARLLFQSGIGPTDMINVVAGHATQGAFLPPTADWINLPVGYNVMDNPSVNLIFTHPSIDSYDNWDYNVIWGSPRPADSARYLKNRSGPFAQSSVRANFWRAYSSPDNKTRWVQGTSRPGGYGIQTNLPYNSSNLWMITTYLSTGFTSRGRIGIDAAMNAKLITQPWWTDPIDKQVHLQALTDLVNNLVAIPGTVMITPDSTTTLKAYVDSYDPSAMNSNHWMGSCKIGVVVDTNVKVIGTDNLFVIDASIFPGMPMGNPHGSIMVAAEMAVDKVLALTGGA